MVAPLKTVGSPSTVALARTGRVTFRRYIDGCAKPLTCTKGLLRSTKCYFIIPVPSNRDAAEVDSKPAERHNKTCICSTLDGVTIEEVLGHLVRAVRWESYDPGNHREQEEDRRNVIQWR